MSGTPSSNTPGAMWTRCETYIDDYLCGTVFGLSATYGSSTKELMTVVSPSIANSPELLDVLLTELQELWPIV